VSGEAGDIGEAGETEEIDTTDKIGNTGEAGEIGEWPLRNAKMTRGKVFSFKCSVFRRGEFNRRPRTKACIASPGTMFEQCTRYGLTLTCLNASKEGMGGMGTMGRMRAMEEVLLAPACKLGFMMKRSWWIRRTGEKD
jgi:hypothetical protein